MYAKGNDGNGHDRGMKNVAYTPSKKRYVVRETYRMAWKTYIVKKATRRLYIVIKATRRDGNGHDRGMKNVAYTPI